MNVIAYRSPVVRTGDDLWKVLLATLPETLPENSVVAVTSKIIALAENRVIAIPSNGSKEEVRAFKHDIVRQESERYIDSQESKYDVMLTIKNRLLAVNAGIDESNTDGVYVLWPQDCQLIANEIWLWLRKQYGVQNVGVIVTDSKTTPLFWGVTGAAVAHSGFLALNDKRHASDIFGRELQMTQVNVMQGLAAAAVLEMGETNEQTPVAVVTDIPEITFQDRTPSDEELASLDIALEDDVYAPILLTAPWKMGGSR